ncbi:helix-turn-helix transcriptional regulator [Paraconexibacter sp. AEG42_29]
MDDDELAGCLRSWRDRLNPESAGLAAGRRRRAPGLRREEVAQLAGLSVDYLARLEQGRADSPSPSVLAPLARALRLTDDERDHLYRLAGHLPPGTGQIDQHLTPAVHRVLDRFTDVPVFVSDPAWWIVATNPLGAALLGDESHYTGLERNVLWRFFLGLPSRVVRTADEDAVFAASAVGDLHDALGRFPADTGLRELIAALRAASPQFAHLWEQRPVAKRTAEHKTFDHPAVGRITVDCDVLTVHGSDLRIVIHTAPPGSPDADALALLGAVGLQTF